MARNYNRELVINLDTLLNKYDTIIDQSDKLEQAFFDGLFKGFDELMEIGTAYAKQRMSDYGLSGELVSNFKATRVGNGIEFTTFGGIKSGSEIGENYHIFVEFGTGLVGSESPHPRASAEGWTYTTQFQSKTGKVMSGWIYPSYPDDRNSAKWTGSDGNLYAFTSGQPARPFMYETWLYLSQTWYHVMSRNINAELKKWGDGFK